MEYGYRILCSVQEDTRVVLYAVGRVTSGIAIHTACFTPPVHAACLALQSIFKVYFVHTIQSNCHPRIYLLVHPYYYFPFIEIIGLTVVGWSVRQLTDPGNLFIPPPPSSFFLSFPFNLNLQLPVSLSHTLSHSPHPVSSIPSPQSLPVLSFFPLGFFFFFFFGFVSFTPSGLSPLCSLPSSCHLR